MLQRTLLNQIQSLGEQGSIAVRRRGSFEKRLDQQAVAGNTLDNAEQMGLKSQADARRHG